MPTVPTDLILCYYFKFIVLLIKLGRVTGFAGLSYFLHKSWSFARLQVKTLIIKFRLLPRETSISDFSWKFLRLFRPFQAWRTIARAHSHALAKAFRSVINHTHKSNFWLRFYYLIACVWSRYVPILMLVLYRLLSLIIKLKLR